MAKTGVNRRDQTPARAVRGKTAALLAIGLLLAAGCIPSMNGNGKSANANSSASAVKGVSIKPVVNDGEAREAFRLVNEARLQRRMPPLVRRQDLDAVAYAHARDLLRMNKLSHTSSDGKQLENRLARLDWIWAGENLARNKGFETPAREAVRGWIASPRHYENMFRPDFTQAGMAAVFDPDSGFTYFVQVFITPVT